MPMKNIMVLISAIMAIPEKKDDKIQSVKITQPLISTKHPIPKAIEFSSVQDLIKSIVGDSDEEINENRQNRSYTNDEHEKNIQVKKQPSPITPTAHPIPKAIEFSSVQDLIRSIVGDSDEEPEENSQNKSKINYNVKQDDKNPYPTTNSKLIHAVKATEYPSVQHLIRSITMQNLNDEKDDTSQGTSTNDLKRNLIGAKSSYPSTNQPIAKAIEHLDVQHLLKSMVKDSEENPDKNYQDLNLTNKEDQHNNNMLVPNTETLNLQNDTQERKKRLKDKKSRKNKKAVTKSGKGKRKSKGSKRKKKKKTTKVTNMGDLSKVDLPQGDDPSAYFTDLSQGDDPNAYFTEYANLNENNNEENRYKFDNKTIVDNPPVVKSELNEVYLKADSDEPHDNDLKVVSDRPHTVADHVQNTKFQAPQNAIQNVKPQNIIMLTFDVSKTRH